MRKFNPTKSDRITPAMTTRVPLSTTVRPTTSGARPNARVHIMSLITMAGGASVRSSAGMSVRPTAAEPPSTAK
jgi:hypothetical protein